MTRKGRQKLHSHERSWPAQGSSNLTPSCEAVNIDEGYVPSENYVRRKADGRFSVAKGRGRPSKPHPIEKGARALGKSPFMNAVRGYLRTMDGVLAESTQIEMDRRLRRMNKDFITLVEKGKIPNNDPWKIDVMDILAYLKLLRGRGVKNSGLCHNVDALTNILRFVGNNAMDRAKMKYPQQFPKRGFKRLPPIASNNRAIIIAAADKISDADWRKIEAYGLVVTAICTGLRPKELRLAKVSEIDMRSATLFTEHVKGEDSYGMPRTTAIHPDGIPFLRRYLKVRNDVLMRNNTPTVEVLFPALQDILKKGDGYFSSNGLTKLREIVTEDTGIVFDLRSCRRTFGQTAVDKKVSIEAVSKMLGHSSTAITEKYYARITEESAIYEAQKVWGLGPNIELNIEHKTEVPSEIASTLERIYDRIRI